MQGSLDVVRLIRIGAPVHAVSMCVGGSHILVGTDGELALYTRHGDTPFRYADQTGELAFHLVRLAPDLRSALAVQRSGKTMKLAISGRGADQVVDIHELRWDANDIYHLSWHSGSGRIALGHYGPALTVMNESGSMQWRRHPHDGNATNGRLWSVALDGNGDRLYVGAAGASTNLLAAVDAASGLIGARTQLPARITQLAALPAPHAVAAILNTADHSVVAAFDGLLNAPVWECPADDGEAFTCLESAPHAGSVVVTSSTGAVRILSAQSGETLAPPLVLESAILSVTVTPDGRQIGVGLTDGRVALLVFTPPTRSEEMLDL